MFTSSVVKKSTAVVGLSLALSTSLLAMSAIAQEKKTEKAEKGKAEPAKKETAKKPESKDSGAVKVTLVTSMGTIKLELDKAKAPKTVDNFVEYVKSGHYAKTIFHRVIPGFMIQGGGMSEKMEEKSTRAPIELEAANGLKNERGTVAMARTSDPNSATAQFFINVVNNDFLNAAPGNPGYAVFGKVTEGMDVVDKIAGVKTGNSGMHQNVPIKPVFIESAKLEK